MSLARDESATQEPIRQAFLHVYGRFSIDEIYPWMCRGETWTRLARVIQRCAFAGRSRLPDSFATPLPESRDFPAACGCRALVLIGGDDKSGQQDANARSRDFLMDPVSGIRACGRCSDQTIKLLQQVNDEGRSSPMQVALVRRMLLIDKEGRIRLTPITEMVQMRGETEREFKLDRKDLLWGKTNLSLHQVTEDDRERPEIVFLGSNLNDHPALILKSCFRCHQGGDLNSRTQNFSERVGPMRARPRLFESTLKDEVAKGIRWKNNQLMSGKLQGLWEAQISK